MIIPTYPARHGMIFQTDPEFAIRPQIRHGACYFMSTIDALSAIFKKPFTHEAVLDFYDSEIDDGDTDVDNEMFIGDPQNLMDDYVGKGRVLFLGARGPEYRCQPDEFEILVFHRDGTDFNHFVHGDGIGGVVYDPWSLAGSASVSLGMCIGKRVTRLLEV
jgi:hypothetical protein